MTPGTGAPLNYGFDGSSDLTTLPSSGTATYDDAGALVSSAQAGITTSFSYDADGQRLASRQGSATSSAGTWNGAGELTSYDDSAADLTAAGYDGAGLRSTATTGAGTENFVWSVSGAAQQDLMDSGNA